MGEINSCLLNTCNKFYVHTANSIPFFLTKSIQEI